MHENTWGRVTFLVNLMFCRLGRFDGSIFRRHMYRGSLYSGLIFGMLIVLHMWGCLFRWTYIRGSINGILQYTICHNYIFADIDIYLMILSQVFAGPLFFTIFPVLHDQTQNAIKTVVEWIFPFFFHKMKFNSMKN